MTPQNASTTAPTPPLPTRHDQFFKETFSDLELAREFFRRALPPEVAQAARWDSLELIPNSFIDADLADSEADLLYLVQLGPDPAPPPTRARAGRAKKCSAPPAVWLYVLFEHQSTVDRDMPFRLLKYIVRVWEAQEKARKPGQKAVLFPVLPVIFHQEASAWTAPRGIWEWLCMKNKALRPMEFLRAWVPDFRHLVLETKDMGELARQAPLLLGLALSLMKATAEGREIAWWDEHEAQLLELLQGDQRALRAIQALISYVFSTVPKNEYSTIVEKIGKLEDKKMKRTGVITIADMLIDQGMVKGKVEGKLEGIAKGKLIGTIRTLQMVLNLEQTPEADLEQRSVEELEKLSRELMAGLHR